MIPLRQLIVKLVIVLLGQVAAGLVAGNQVVTQFPVLKTCDIPTTLLSYEISLPSTDCLLLGISLSILVIVQVDLFVRLIAPLPVIQPFFEPQPAPAA